MPPTDEPVKNPTWLADIRFFFTPEDINHMGRRGIDLATYAGVKANAIRVMGATEPPDATMPPDPREKWSEARWATFKNWIVNGYPFGTAVPQRVPREMLRTRLLTASRVRRDAADLSADELDRVRKAFQGIMALPPDDPRSYFANAAKHWLPGPPFYCLHHENRYNPWHRAYLFHFENALRTVPGCQDVTLPYWDITRPPPDFLYQPPFDKYVLPRDIGDGFPAGYATIRNPAAEIMEHVERTYRIPAKIDEALTRSVWSQFNRDIIKAHDDGHMSIGETVSQQDVASYDPIFWFFHCNLDRLWWKWQQSMSATTLTGFLSTVRGSTDWLRTAPFNAIPPFAETADQTIDLAASGVDYEHPPEERLKDAVPESFGSLRARDLKRVHSAGRASVRVKGIDRLSIPGSFVVHLQRDGETIASQGFFQARNPRTCANCVKQGLVDIDLEVDLEQLRGGTPLNVVLEPMWPDAIGRTFPLSTAGDPSVNVRLLLEQDD